MKLSAASSYAVHALVNLAGREEGEPVPSHLIAEAEGMSEGFLLKALGLLVRAQIL
jgi:DNA-binding IscR family transcriptional regulator